MPRTKLIRRRPALSAPFFAAPFFSTPSFTQAIEDLGARTDEMMRAAFAGFPELPEPGRFPLLNVSEGKDEYTVTAELPGMTAKDVTVDYADGVLAIRGEKEQGKTKEEDELKYYLWERWFGSFQRALPFPGGIAEDKIAAEFKDGVLTVRLPKADEAKVKGRSIPVSAM